MCSSIKKTGLSTYLIVVLCGLALCAEAQSPQFKRIKVDEQPPGQRINIQIEEPTIAPSDNSAVAADGENAATDLLPDLGAQEEYPPLEDSTIATWFWAQSPADLSSASPLSLRDAAEINGPEAAQLDPELQHLERLSAKYGNHLLRYGAEMGVSPALLLAVMYVESAGKPDAVSSAGAQGLMQLIPATAARFNVSDAKDPPQAIRGAAQYMRFLLDEFGGDAILALAGYNAGENAVLEHGGVPPYTETRNYVPKVVAAWRIARLLCMTEQDFPTDGCVFVNLG
ncbi:MAG: lytic transglycosylase domain-containing protein [Pseudomonadota bacterium]